MQDATGVYYLIKGQKKYLRPISKRLIIQAEESKMQMRATKQTPEILKKNCRYFTVGGNWYGEGQGIKEQCLAIFL